MAIKLLTPYLRSLICGVLAIVFCTACSSLRAPSVSEVISKSKQPETPKEVLQNIKIAIDNHLISKNEFYSEENLKNLFGGTYVTLSTNGIEEKNAYISGYDNMVEPIQLQNTSIPSLDITLSMHKKNGRVDGNLHFIIRKSGAFPDMPASVEIFGSDWQENPEPTSPHEIFSKGDSPYGNERIQYLKDGEMPNKLNIEFNGDGSLYRIDYTEEKND